MRFFEIAACITSRDLCFKHLKRLKREGCLEAPFLPTFTTCRTVFHCTLVHKDEQGKDSRPAAQPYTRQPAALWRTASDSESEAARYSWFLASATSLPVKYMSSSLDDLQEQANAFYAALARTVARGLALYFSRPVRLFRPSKGALFHFLVLGLNILAHP